MILQAFLRLLVRIGDGEYISYIGNKFWRRFAVLQFFHLLGVIEYHVILQIGYLIDVEQ